jgi:phosphoribosylanthranilate isomerase
VNTNQPLIKICGTTSVQDAQLAAAAGAHYLGIIVDFPPSPRHIALPDAQEITRDASLPIVAVTVNQSLEQLLRIQEVMAPHALQLHGDESPELVRQLVQNGVRVWAVASGERQAVLARAREMSDAGAEVILVDARITNAQGTIYGGTGHVADWEAARLLVDEGHRVALAGGLNPQNVHAAIEQVQPWLVDVISGVEACKGVKDADKILSFVKNAVSRRDAEAQRQIL